MFVMAWLRIYIIVGLLMCTGLLTKAQNGCLLGGNVYTSDTNIDALLNLSLNSLTVDVYSPTPFYTTVANTCPGWVNSYTLTSRRCATQT